MRRVLAFVAVFATACTPRYVPPAAGAPHAIVKIRAISHDAPGPQYSAFGLIDGAAIDWPRDTDPKTVATVALPIRPGRRAVRFGVAFTHTVTRQVTETTTQYTPCGSNGATCPTQSTHTRSVTDVVTDGRCDATVVLNAAVDASYLVNFDYLGGTSCALKCFLQTPTDGGQFSLTPCNRSTDPAPSASTDGAAP